MLNGKSLGAAALLLLMSAGPVLAFGAIAVDDQEGVSASEVGYGVGWGNSRREAERNALEECRDAGNRSCRVAVWFETCGAYAGSRSHFQIGYGRTLRDAEEAALTDCPKCRIVVSQCE